MQGTQPLPEKIVQWLRNRCISDKVIGDFMIEWSNNRLVIPVFNEDGECMFQKSRRNPLTENTNEAKYKYDFGAKSMLYGFMPSARRYDAYQPWGNVVVLCEGELDVLALISQHPHFKVYSTTGGSCTFDPDWISPMVKKVYICYDNDDAGIKGAHMVSSVLPNSRIMRLPEPGMDVTDYFVSGKTLDDFIALMDESVSYTYPPISIPEASTKKEQKQLLRDTAASLDTYTKQKKELEYNRKDGRHLTPIIDMWTRAYKTIERKYKKKYLQPQSNGSMQDNITRAKSHPIENYLTFNSKGYHPCLWHKEKTASMFYNKEGKYENTVKCFGCGKMGDTIDVVMALNKVGFNDAITIILGYEKK